MLLIEWDTGLSFKVYRRVLVVEIKQDCFLNESFKHKAFVGNCIFTRLPSVELCQAICSC